VHGAYYIDVAQFYIDSIEFAVRYVLLWADFQNILQQSYDYLTIMPNLRSTYDGRLIYQTSYEERKLFLGTIHLQNRKIVSDSVRKLPYDIPKRNLSIL